MNNMFRSNSRCIIHFFKRVFHKDLDSVNSTVDAVTQSVDLERLYDLHAVTTALNVIPFHKDGTLNE
jgi:hypothetical protein